MKTKGTGGGATPPAEKCLFYGANHLSQLLRYSLVPTGYLYVQNKNTLGPRRKRKFIIFLSFLVSSVIPLRQAFYAFNSKPVTASAQAAPLMSLNVSFNHTNTTNNSHILIISPDDPEQSPVIYYSFYYLPLTVFIKHMTMWIYSCLLHHDSIVTILASNYYNLIDKQKQKRVARLSFMISYCSEIVAAIGYLFWYISFSTVSSSEFKYVISIALTLSNIYFNLNAASATMFLCYTGYSIGQNVKRFSELYIENMLNNDAVEEDKSTPLTQFLTITTADLAITNNTGADITTSADHHHLYGGANHDNSDQLRQTNNNNEANHGVRSTLNMIINSNRNTDTSNAPSITATIVKMTAPTAAIIQADQEMLMLATAQLTSSYTNDKHANTGPLLGANSHMDTQEELNRRIDRIFRQNNQLIRSRLRRTVKLLGKMKDDLINLNKIVSPVFAANMLHYGHFILYATSYAITAISDPASEDAPFSVAVCLPLMLSFAIYVLQNCICLGSVPSELNLMMNRLFDAIVTNQSLKHQSLNNNKQQRQATSPLLLKVNNTSEQVPSGNRLSVNNGDCAQMSANNTNSNQQHQLIALKTLKPSIRSSSAANYNHDNDDDGELCETWSQYKYARELSDSIYFNLSGITPISRRVVLTIFAHALSLLFISIELLRIFAPGKRN